MAASNTPAPFDFRRAPANRRSRSDVGPRPRASHSAWALRWLAWAYLWLFRGKPVLLQIIFAFNVLPSFGVILSGPACAVLALGLHEAAYMIEIIRGGLAALTLGQRDAARALGMSDWRVMRLVVLPQALRLVVPPIGNQFAGAKARPIHTRCNRNCLSRIQVGNTPAIGSAGLRW